MAERARVLSLYRRILRVSQSWVAKVESETPVERNYIKTEAQTLFRKNRHLSDPQSIKECIREGDARLELALHYQIPYPRPVNLPAKSLSIKKGKEQGSVQEKMKKRSKPIYIRSLE